MLTNELHAMHLFAGGNKQQLWLLVRRKPHIYLFMNQFDHAVMIIACFFSLHKNSDIQAERSSSIIWHWQCIFWIYYFWAIPCVHMHWYSIAFKISVRLHYERHNKKRAYYTLFGSIFFIIRPPPELLPVLGPLEWYMTPTLDSILCYWETI